MYKFETIGDIPVQQVRCLECGYESGGECIDPSTPTPSPTPVPPTPSHTSIPPTPSHTSIPTSSSTPTSTTILPLVDVEVPNNQEVHVNESVSYNYHLQGNATFVIETQTSIIISPSEIVDNKETTINIQGSTTSNSITIQSFEKANVHLSNDSPLKINDVSEIHLSKESGSINIGEVKTDKTDIAITSTISTNVERVLFIGSRTITVSENIEVSNIEMSESIEGTIKSSRISGTTNIVRGSILHATDCEFTSDSIISFNIESIGETNKLILSSTSSSSKFIQTLASSFNAKEINIDIHDSERNGESTLIEGLGDTCSNYLSVVHVNKEGFTTSCTSEGSLIISNEGSGSSNNLIYIIAGVAGGVVLIVVIIIVIVILKKRSKTEDGKGETSASENIGNTLQSPLLF